MISTEVPTTPAPTADSYDPPLLDECFAAVDQAAREAAEPDLTEVALINELLAS